MFQNYSHLNNNIESIIFYNIIYQCYYAQILTPQFELPQLVTNTSEKITFALQKLVK